jgi:hypothetical protein
METSLSPADAAKFPEIEPLRTVPDVSRAVAPFWYLETAANPAARALLRGATDWDDSHWSERDMQEVPIFSG